MISPAMQVLLLIGATGTVFIVLRGIRRAQVLIRDSLFWIFFSLVLLILSIFPELALRASQLLGFESPINLVFLVIIFLLFLQQFLASLRISSLSSKVKTLTQKLALAEKQLDDLDP